jgi:hypothetical protein
MDIKSFKINSKQIFKMIYLVIAIINLVCLILLFQFVKNNVYGSVYVDQTYLDAQKIKTGGDLDLNKFNSVVSALEQKQQKKSVDNIKNLFN